MNSPFLWRFYSFHFSYLKAIYIKITLIKAICCFTTLYSFDILLKTSSSSSLWSWQWTFHCSWSSWVLYWVLKQKSIIFNFCKLAFAMKNAVHNICYFYRWKQLNLQGNKINKIQNLKLFLPSVWNIWRS